MLLLAAMGILLTAANPQPQAVPDDCRVSLPSLPPVRHRIYLSPSGSDSNDGSASRPVATLAAARDRARAARGVGTVEVEIAPGEYRMTDTLTFTEEDSGTAASPIVYRAHKQGTAVFTGGTRISGFKPVTDPAVLERLSPESRDKVYQCDLRAQGIADYGELAVRGYSQQPSPPTLELYVNGEPQTLARWPNKGFVHPTKLVDPGNVNQGTPSVLGYDGDRPARWTKADDAWLFGYFQYLWADGTVKIAKIDPVAKTISTDKPYHYGSTGMTTEQGIKFYAFNLLEEIDEPGEWYLDRKTGTLYLYPPCDLSKANVEISMLTVPMVKAAHLSHVRFEGLVFDLGRYDGLQLSDCSDCQLVGCRISRFAGNGVSVVGGFRDTLLSCDVFDTGRRATEIVGGDRETLTPGGHVVANCCIHDFGRIDRTYTSGVQLEGVGNRVLHNLFYNCPSSAMRLEGNDLDVEYNEVHDVVQESDDQGAMELFRNPTYRGVVFRYNYFHDIGWRDGEQPLCGQAGIRLDDAISGMLIYGNVFVRASYGSFGEVQINSGRDNVIDNNVFSEAERGISGGYYPGNGSWKELASDHKPPEFITSELYLKRYPALAWMLKQPAVNYAKHNVFYRVRTDISGDRKGFDLKNNGVFQDANPGFANPSRGDFRMNALAPALTQLGFTPIPFDKIGLYRDEWRRNPIVN